MTLDCSVTFIVLSVCRPMSIFIFVKHFIMSVFNKELLTYLLTYTTSKTAEIPTRFYSTIKTGSTRRELRTGA